MDIEYLIYLKFTISLLRVFLSELTEQTKASLNLLH